jgi:hypothetical protein
MPTTAYPDTHAKNAYRYPAYSACLPGSLSDSCLPASQSEFYDFLFLCDDLDISTLKLGDWSLKVFIADQNPGCTFTSLKINETGTLIYVKKYHSCNKKTKSSSLL